MGFQKKKNVRGKIIAHQENKLVFSRGSYWKLLEKIKIDDGNYVYIMQLIAQPMNQKLDTNKHQLPKVIYTFNEFKKLGVTYNEDKSLYDKFKNDVDENISKHISIFIHYTQESFPQFVIAVS